MQFILTNNCLIVQQCFYMKHYYSHKYNVSYSEYKGLYIWWIVEEWYSSLYSVKICRADKKKNSFNPLPRISYRAFYLFSIISTIIIPKFTWCLPKLCNRKMPFITSSLFFHSFISGWILTPSSPFLSSLW